ncbi:hypothetical protein [Bacillus thuringiensis]|nr:hypothetical protein [Bacillus thuringiensis]MCU5031534.1 hypothetical protein [Bacillus cereus]MRA75121.1 hypothetical protein [Bacillus thuringiensis]MRA92349.1 hypothetical protein [Bacillus thuringiensis]HDR4441321.1 hypothetical protein [Bacillus cereus]
MILTQFCMKMIALKHRWITDKSGIDTLKKFYRLNVFTLLGKMFEIGGL